MTDFIDIPELQRRGILKRAEQKKDFSPKTDVVDFTQNLPIQQAPQTETNPFNFLDSLASSAQTSEQKSYLPQETISPDRNSAEAKLLTLTAKFEDLEYKINNLIDRLIELETKIN